MDMDQRAIIPFLGYQGPGAQEEYYRSASSVGKLHRIRVPTIFLNAEDDPCYDGRLYPYKEFEGGCDYILLAMTKRGGHCGHLTGGLFPI